MPQNFDQLQRRRGRALWLIGILMTAMCAVVVLGTLAGDEPILEIEQRWPALVGLCGLVALFVLYVQHQHRQLSTLEARLRDVAVREAALQAHFSELSSLFDVSIQLQLRLDLQSMLELAAQRLLSCLDAQRASIMLFNEATGLLEVRAAAGVDAERAVNATLKPGEGVAGQTFTSGEVLNLTGEAIRQRFADPHDGRPSFSAALCVPMFFKGTPIGVVCVSREGGELFGDLHARMLVAFAEHCAATVVKTHHHYELLESVRKAS